jgi:hypothetical protein
MNFQAAVKGIAPAGGIRPASHITASFVSATKAKPAAHYFGRVPKAADITSVRLGSARCGIAQPRRNKGAASLTKAPSAFRKIGEAVNRQGTLTITGSNVRLGTEMPVALSLFP